MDKKGNIFSKGFDIIDKICPNCGHNLIATKRNKDGDRLLTCYNFDLGIMDENYFFEKYNKTNKK